jgi:hypothetical protein
MENPYLENCAMVGEKSTKKIYEHRRWGTPRKFRDVEAVTNARK